MTSPHPIDVPLFEAARAVRQNAYAPYSRFFVGAALRLTDGRIFIGTNVENCSYGLALCAERAAVLAAVAAGAKPMQVQAVAVVTDALTLSSPCGACRQVLVEFAPPTAIIALHNLRDATHKHVTMLDLLPHAFTPQSLRDDL